MSSPLKHRQEDLFNYSYGRYLPNGILVLAFLALLLGVKFVLDAISLYILWLIPAMILFIVGFALFLPIELLQIDFKQRTYRIGIKIFSKIYGTWNPVGEIKYLSIITTKKRLTLSSNSAGPSIKDDIVEEYQLKLYNAPGKHITIDEYQSKESAIIIAKLIAQGFELKILDATIKPAEFIELEH